MTISPAVSLRGALRPRVEHRPADVVESLGELTGRLATMAGIPPDPWQADGHEIMLGLREDGNWAAADYAEWVGRQQGKTGGIGVPRILTGLFLLPERLFLWSSHLASTSTEAFEMIRDALLNLGEEIKPDLIEVPPLELPGALREPLYVQVISANGKEGFRTRTEDRRRAWRKRVLMVSRSKGGGRGLPADVRVVDETYAYTTAQQAALAPTRLAKPFAQTIYLSSPPLNGEEGAVMFRLRERAEEGDPRLGYRDWGLAATLDEFGRLPREKRREFLFDRANWVAALPALGLGRVTEEGVLALLNEFADDADAAREVFGLWPERVVATAGAWSVIAENAWTELADLTSQFEGRPVMAVDTSPDHASTSIAAAGRRADGLGHIEIVRSDAGSGWALDEIVRLHRAHRPRTWLLDPASAAGSLIIGMQEHGIEPQLLTGRELAQACGAFHRDVVENAGLRHRDQAVLNKAVSDATWRQLADARAWNRRTPDSDISPLVAVTEAWHGYAKNAASKRPPRIW